jgi:hypothetical protein
VREGGPIWEGRLDRKIYMQDNDRSHSLWDLANELLVVSALLEMMTSRLQTESAPTEPTMMEMCSSSNLRCQNLVDRLLKIELREH